MSGDRENKTILEPAAGSNGLVTDNKEAEAADKEQKPDSRHQEPSVPDKEQEETCADGTPPKEDIAREDVNRRVQEQTRADDAARDAQKKKDQDGTAFRKDDYKKDKEPTRFRGFFLRIRDLAMRVYHYVKHTVERAIGRGRIPSPPRVNVADFSRSSMDPSRKKDDPSVDRATQDKSREKGRDWKELFYHGIARRILGKEAYVHAIQQNEKREASRQEKGTQEQAPAQKENAGHAKKEQQGRTEHPGSQEKPERAGKAENAKNQEQRKPEKGEAQKEAEEMKGKFKALHKLITNDLEDRYSNAKETKEAYLSYYAKQLQEKLTELNQGEPVQISAARKDGKLEIRINNEREQYGGYSSFMGCSMIQIDIDKHLNVISAEAFVPTRQSDDGRFIGRKIDVSETLGAYIVSDLARNFREDYNRGEKSYNLTSRNEFEKTMRDAATQGRNGFTVDNISYLISVKDNKIQISQTDGGKAFTIAMDADTQKPDPFREAYETKIQKLQDIEKELKTTKEARSEKAANAIKLDEIYKQAQTKALETEQKVCNIRECLKKIESQMSGKYPGPQKMQELKEQQAQILKDRAAAFREKGQTFTAANVAKADYDIAVGQVKKLDEQITALEQKAGAMRDACRDAKEQYDKTSLGQEETDREVYQAHVRSVVESRESSIRAFEEILPGQKNEIGGNFKLEDLNKAMEETGRTSMEEALNAQSRDMQHDPLIGEERGAGLEGREIDELE